MTTKVDCDAYEWIELCQSEAGDEHFIDPQIVSVKGSVVEVRRSVIFAQPDRTRWGAVAGSQSLERVDLSTGTWSTQKEVLIGLEGQVLNINEQVDGNELPSLPGSVNAAGLAFLRALLRNRKRQQLSIKRRHKKHLLKRTRSNNNEH
ncbi:hypothetical protein H6F90_00240 [Trichocoleus sp. FACHB-591]|uniref:hypothetical protein n=1 Tax=Trichocoleus sp. FACHB-591 TaxID=2692872 RepID=UPI0016825319|nr:hypothetical protein [Trichocoleus sp. FACHB-591]MBD2093583.1 hypothetical protein [Trichocoleus sp. FACHB-591]